MRSVWLVFCDCGFHSVCPLKGKDKSVMEASWLERLTEGKTGSCSDGCGHAQSIFNPIICWWEGLYSLPVVWPEATTGGNENNGHLSAPYHAAGHRRPTPPPETAGHSRTSCGVTATFSWVLVHTRFCLCPLRVCFTLSCVSSDSSTVGLIYGIWVAQIKNKKRLQF